MHLKLFKVNRQHPLLTLLTEELHEIEKCTACIL